LHGTVAQKGVLPATAAQLWPPFWAGVSMTRVWNCEYLVGSLPHADQAVQALVLVSGLSTQSTLAVVGGACAHTGKHAAVVQSVQLLSLRVLLEPGVLQVSPLHPAGQAHPAVLTHSPPFWHGGSHMYVPRYTKE
jgi:hypothetical protein